MKVFRNFEDARNIKNPVVTTGSFDGVHIGHRIILDRLKMLADKYNGESVLITFHPHPRKVLYPESSGKNLKLINSQEEKLELLEKTGLNNLIIIEFTREFSKVTSEEFVREYLHRILGARVIVAGFNHHFGFNKEGDYKHLWAWQEKYGFEAEEIPEKEVFHETVSSTKIRQALNEGYIQRANAYLDQYYIIKGEAGEYFTNFTNGQNFPVFFRLPITEELKLIPPAGIYAVSAETENGRSKGMVIIHNTEYNLPGVLVNVFDDSIHTQGQKLTLFFHKKIHGAVNFSDSRSAMKILSSKDEIDNLIF